MVEAELPVDLSSVSSELAALLTQAWALGILPEASLRTILDNLQRGSFSTEHYLQVYKDRVWKATHPEQVAVMEAAAEKEKQQQRAEEAEVLRALKATRLLRPSTNAPPIVSSRIGSTVVALHARYARSE